MLNLTEEAKTLWRARSLAWTLAKRDFAVRHAGSVGGIGWAYAQPMLMVAAYYLVFDVVFAMRLGEHAPTKAAGVFLIVGSLPWMAFCDAIQRSMNSLVESGGVLQKNALPIVLFPARSVIASACIFVPLILLMAMAYWPLHQFSPSLVLIVPMLLIQFILSTLLGYLLAIFAAALRDTVQFVGFVLSVGIFLSPVLFPTTMFPQTWRWVLWFNPMSAIVVAYQTILLQGAWPDNTVWVVMGVWIALVAVMLNLVIRRSKDQVVDWL